MKFNRQSLLAIACAGCFVCGGVCCQQQQMAGKPAAGAPVATAPMVANAFAPVMDRRLENAHVVTTKVIAGAQPEGDEAFAALRGLGVKTIISVDGSAPDVETARKFGLRYVHLPITYATVTEEQGKAIAKAIDEMPGPVYVHCHHGKHRSAAAVAVACVFDGSLKPEQAESVLATFGTGEEYKGLWKAAREARPLDPREIRDMNIRFVETAKIPKVAEAMVLMDGQLDHLKAIQKAGWRTPADHRDLDPPHEALQLQEHLREIGRGQMTRERPEDFRRRLGEAERGSVALRELLLAKPIDAQAADAAMKVVGSSCLNCHKAYRD